MTINAINALGLLLFAFLSNQAIADEEIEKYFAMSPAELANIPVTIATGSPKPMFQSAAITSVITAEQIKSMGATELHEVLETVPGVHASLQENTYDYSYSIRGIKNNANSQVLILLNGTRITTPFGGTLMTGTEMPLEAIQRVEVIRGPGSALYGADAFAGVINIITKNANDINGSKVGVRAGAWDSQSTWAQHSNQIGDWKIAGELQYQHTNGDSGRTIQADTQTVFDSMLGTNASNAPGSLNTRYETLNGHLNLQRKHWDVSFWGFNSINGGLRAGATGALDPKGTLNGEQYLGDVKFTTEDWYKNLEITAHASYLETDFLARIQAFPNNTKLPIGADGNIQSPLSNSKLVTFPDGANANIGRIEKVPSFEFGTIYKGIKNHNLRLNSGFRYETITASESKNFGTGVINGSQNIVYGNLTNITETPFVYLPDIDRSIWSEIIQDEWQFAKNWQLTAGVRYDDYSDFGGTLNPRAALVWDINNQLTSKILYGKAFRAPSFSEQANQNNPALIGNKNLKPETINTVEWALDYRPFSALRTAVNVYFYEINNLISAVPQTNGITSKYQNSGNQDGYGSEFEWDWQISEKWNAKGNYAWQNATNPDSNNRIYGVPEHHIYSAISWHFLQQWQLQSQLNWIGGRAKAENDKKTLDDYETVDLTIRGKKLLKHINVAASIRNAFDNRFREPAANQFFENLPMQGRSFYLEASVEF